MMDLSEIKQYSHKIIKINITNNNSKSSYGEVTIKVHLEKETNETIRFSLTKNPSPKEWINHQSIGDDYFLVIKNVLAQNNNPGITEIYAHYFPSELYDYTEDTEICSVYDFSDFTKDTTYNQWDGMEYPLQIKSYGYEMVLGYDNKPLIRSLLNNSVTRYKDPNYKNYIKTNIQKNISDMTEKGRFPLSSRYRNSLYRTAPNINDTINFKLPYWQAENEKYSHGTEGTEVTHSNETGYKYYNENDVSSTYQSKYGETDNCAKRASKIPFWEAKIFRSGLSPLIEKTPEEQEESKPINVYLNYQYLPTSTEYHQHYFGFEGLNIKDQNGNIVPEMITAVESYIPDKNNIIRYDAETTNTLRNQLHEYCENIKNGIYKQRTANNTYEVLDGEGLEDINQEFGMSSKTYRIIRHGNPFDYSKSFYLDHKHIYDVNLEVKITDNCSWKKNQCQQYWSYIPQGQGNVYFNITLKANTYYVLKYFMFIPADAYIEEDSCYAEVQSNVNGQTVIIGELPQAFKNQDKKLRHQWIYHEIPFYTLETNNRIVIKGPQHNHEDIVGINRLTGELTSVSVNNPNIEIHDCKNDVIHFYSFQIAEMVEYSPTLKYTKTGLYLVEGNKYTKKSLEESKTNTCTNDKTAMNQWATHEALNPSDTWINKGTTQLPIPLTDIYIFFDDEFDIIYNKLTTEISYIKGDFPFKFSKFDETFDETLSWLSDDNIINLQYDKATSPYDSAMMQQKSSNRNNDDLDINQLFLGELRLFNTQRKFFTTGVNNKFTLKLQDAYGNPISDGKVELSIWTSNHEDTTPCSESYRCLGEKEPNEYGEIEFQHLNFKNFKPNIDTYYLRIVYENVCYNKTIIKWKKIHFLKEHKNMFVYANTCNKKICKNNSGCCQLTTSSIYDENNDDYNKVSYSYTIKSVEEFPLRLDVKIEDQLHNEKNEGYCELSINDKVIQTTFVDDNGIADFYLDEIDLDPGVQIIKIEYYENPDDSINFVYFPIICDALQGYDERPAIPIRINKVENEEITELTNQIYEITKDNIFFCDIDIENHNNFSISIIRNNDEQEIINFEENNEKKYVISTMYKTHGHLKNENNQDIDKYIIITGNLKDTNGNDITHTYRTTKKEFTLLWGDIYDYCDISLNSDGNLVVSYHRGNITTTKPIIDMDISNDNLNVRKDNTSNINEIIDDINIDENGNLICSYYNEV